MLEYQLKAALSEAESVSFDLNPAAGGTLLSRSARDRVKLWLSGADLMRLNESLGVRRAKSGTLQHARKFVKDFIWSLSYLGGAVSRMARAHVEEGITSQPVSLGLATLAACIREGFDNPEKVAIRHASRGDYWRRQCHRIHSYAAGQIPPGSSDEQFSSTVDRVRTGVMRSGIPL